MMAVVQLLKTPNGFEFYSDTDRDKCQRFAVGDYIQADIKRPRNPSFHRKFFALLRFGFEYWQPGPLMVSDIEIPVVKNEALFEAFRNDILILAGYYDYYVPVQTDDPRGYVLRAKSISFGNMDEIEFQDVYSSVKMWIWAEVLEPLNTREHEEWEAALNEYEGSFV